MKNLGALGHARYLLKMANSWRMTCSSRIYMNTVFLLRFNF